MPIYAYRCAACGHSRDVLQKMSDAPLTQCPACGAEQFAKQITAAGFQLKGSGWYATDFRNSGGASSSGSTATPADAPAKSEGTAASGGGEAGASSGASTSAGSTPCGGSCACH